MKIYLWASLSSTLLLLHGVSFNRISKHWVQNGGVRNAKPPPSSNDDNYTRFFGNFLLAEIDSIIPVSVWDFQTQADSPGTFPDHLLRKILDKFPIWGWGY